MRYVLIIIIALLFSANLYAVTYLVCENGQKPLHIKLEYKKIYLKYDDSDKFANYSKLIFKWSDEIIVLEQKKIIENPNPKKYISTKMLCLFSDTYTKESVFCKNPKNYVPSPSISMEGIEKFIINRLDGTVHYSNPYASYTYKCKVRNKTLF